MISIFSNIKIWLGIVATFLIGGLYAALKIQKAEKKTAESKADFALDAAKEANTVIRIKGTVDNAKTSADAASNDELDSLLSKYDRNRKN